MKKAGSVISEQQSPKHNSPVTLPSSTFVLLRPKIHTFIYYIHLKIQFESLHTQVETHKHTHKVPLLHESFNSRGRLYKILLGILAYLIFIQFMRFPVKCQKALGGISLWNYSPTTSICSLDG